MIAKIFYFCLTAAYFEVVSSFNCNYCKNGNNGAKTTYITPSCYAPDFPRNKNVGGCSRVVPFSFSSSDARCIGDVSCLVLNSGNARYDNLTNFGTYLQTRIVEQQRPITLSGGVAYDDTYILYEDQFYWGSSVCAQDGLFIDGQSAPAAALSIYYNRKYGFFEKALEYADGLIGTVAQVQIRPYSNPAFDRFGRDVLLVKKYGSSATVLDADVYPWFLVFNGTCNYYAYPGQYLDQYGAWHNSITYVAFPSSTSSPYIGEDQFKNTFLQLLNQFGKPLSNLPPTNRRCNRPIVCAQGIKLTIS